MKHCPHCQSTNVRHSRAKSLWEKWRQRILFKRPFRCRSCNWRGWGAEVGPTFSERATKRSVRAMEPSRLDLVQLDAFDDVSRTRKP